MTLAVQIIGMFSGLSAFATLCILLVRPLRERVLDTKAVREGQRCLLRNEITAIYYRHNGEETPTLREYERLNLDDLYAGYKALDGNSYIEDIYHAMRDWRVKS